VGQPQFVNVTTIKKVKLGQPPVAETDPAPEVQGHSIRKSASQAIAAIQKRASGPAMPGSADH
jgi:hypothetical protein